MKYWLMKSEPSEFSIDDLAKVQTARWTGVRNYQARNFMTQQMSVGDLVLFYHSNAEPSGVAGVARVSAAAAPDPTQFEKKSDYFDAKSTKESPRWFCVEVEFVKKLPGVISLAEIKANPKLAKMEVLRKGNRLSIQPVTAAEFKELSKA